MNSIRRYLLSYLISALLIGTAIIAGVIYLNTKHEIDELFNEHLRQLARTVIHQQDNLDIPNVPAEGESLATTLKSKKKQIKGEEEFLIQIWNMNDQLVYSSHPLITFPKIEGTEIALSSFKDDNWKSYHMHSDKWQVQVSQPLKARREMIREIGFNNLIPSLIQIPLLGMLIWIAVGRSLLPVATLSQAISRRRPGALEKLDDPAPTEIKPLVHELNNLMERQANALTVQRQFTSDAAHELRTPLTAIQLQADILARADTAEERQQANDRLRAGVERAAYLIQQLLTLARIEPHATQTDFQPAILAPVIQKALDLQAAAAATKTITTTSQLEPALAALIDPESLATALNSILDNAIRFTPAGGCIAIKLFQAGETIAIEIADSGPGIPPAEYRRVFDRFYRVTGTGVSGTGLGLSIAKEIVEQHQGQIVLGETAGGGLTTTIFLKQALHLAS